MKGELQLAHGIVSEASKLPDKPGLPGNSAGDADKPIFKGMGREQAVSLQFLHFSGMLRTSLLLEQSDASVVACAPIKLIIRAF